MFSTMLSMVNTKTVINALNTLNPGNGGIGSKVDHLFGDKPDILDAIIDARKRRCSFKQIAMALSTDEHTLSAGAVQNWLTAKGIK
jgi:hypothetical protein